MIRHLVIITALLWMTLAKVSANNPIDTTEQIRQAVNMALEQKVSDYADQLGATRYELHSRLSTGLNRLKPCAKKPEVVSMAYGKPLLGVTRQKVICREPAPWSVIIQTRVAIYSPVLVSRKTISSSHTVNGKDVGLVEMDLADLPDNYLTSVKEVIGKKLRYRVSAGKVITSDLLERELLVNKGDKVVIEFHSTGLHVKMSGIALEDGELNEQIKVRNAESGKIIDGLIMEAGKVSPL
ncbi:flagellar basal body P-ring formation chaperone FlgA [Endozoicomonas sp. Mp262]|uniref:flagellar basal body P-ring formation chaperone FlgA n=1 Tax=Endozoicomonas sp. Mp262 TaxID=2919499 RepID=UPI0021D9224F